MPWEHCETSWPDDAACDCGATKEDWTVTIDHTREFTVTKRRKKKQADGWLELELLDARGEAAPAGTAYVVTLPSGQELKGELEEGGCKRLEGIAPGACEVRFPEHPHLDRLAGSAGGGKAPAGLKSLGGGEEDERRSCAVGEKHVFQLQPRLRAQVGFPRAWDWKTLETIAEGEFVPLSLARVEVHAAEEPDGELRQVSAGSLDGEGRLDLPASAGAARLALKLLLCDAHQRVVKVQGNSDPEKMAGHTVDEPDFSLQSGEVTWHLLELDLSQGTQDADGVDLGRVTVDHLRFIELCFIYESICLGYFRLKELTGQEDIGKLCVVELPEPRDETGSTAYFSGYKDHIRLREGAFRSRWTHLHEYGHFITCWFGTSSFCTTYEYDGEYGHFFGGRVLYEAAWSEGIATFLGQALLDDPVKRYPGGDAYDFVKGGSPDGAHSEACVAEALLRLLWGDGATPGVEFEWIWKAWTDHSKRLVKTPLDFYLNWLELGLPHLDRLLAAFEWRNMHEVYDFSERWTVAEAWDEERKRFDTFEALYARWGRAQDDLRAYKIELFHHNEEFSDDFESVADIMDEDTLRLDEGASPELGAEYLVPRAVRMTSAGLVYTKGRKPADPTLARIEGPTTLIMGEEVELKVVVRQGEVGERFRWDDSFGVLITPVGSGATARAMAAAGMEEDGIRVRCHVVTESGANGPAELVVAIREPR